MDFIIQTAKIIGVQHVSHVDSVQLISTCQSLVLTKVMVMMQHAPHAIAQLVLMYLGVVG